MPTLNQTWNIAKTSIDYFWVQWQTAYWAACQTNIHSKGALSSLFGPFQLHLTVFVKIKVQKKFRSGFLSLDHFVPQTFLHMRSFALVLQILTSTLCIDGEPKHCAARSRTKRAEAENAAINYVRSVVKKHKKHDPPLLTSDDVHRPRVEFFSILRSLYYRLITTLNWLSRNEWKDQVRISDARVQQSFEILCSSWSAT